MRGNALAFDTVHAAFAPRPRDDEDLRWFFAQGPRPSLRGRTQGQQKRWRRVNRCLDGGGYNLARHYSRQPTDDLELAAEYRRFVQNMERSYAAGEWAPYMTVSTRVLRALVERAKPKHKIMVQSTWSDDPRYVQRTLADDDPRAVTDVLQSIPFSTFGDRRVDGSSAKFLLEITGRQSFAESQRLSDARALDLFRDRLKRIPAFLVESACDERGIARPWDDDDRPIARPLRGEQKTKEHARTTLVEFAEAGASGSMRCDAPGSELLAFMRNELRWDLTKIEIDPERPNTAVTEIARWVKLDTKWIRRVLAKHGCAGVALKRQPIPTAWLRSDRGRDFWADAANEIRLRQAADLLVSGARFRSASRAG